MRSLLSVLLVAGMLTACSRGTVSEREQKGNTQRATYQAGPVVDQKHGKEVWLATGAITGVGGINMNGVAVSHVFEDGASIVTVQANVYPPAAGKEYVAWLLGSGQEQIRLGVLQSSTGDARHQLAYEGDRDVRDFTQVEITQEEIGSDVRNGSIEGSAALSRRER